MKQGFAKIFGGSKRSWGIAALCLVIIATSMAGASVAYGSDDAKADTIDNIALFNEGDRYGLAGGKFIVRYDGKDTVVPLTPDTDDENVYFADKAVYVSDEVTGVAYGDAAKPGSPVMVLMSSDKGNTWDSFKVPDTKAGDYEQKYMGFTTKDDGWLLLAGGVSMGSQKNRIFQTADGGKTWDEIGNTAGTYERVVTGAGFAGKDVGFVSFRYDNDANPAIYRTEDGGKSWNKCSIQIPDSFKGITSYAEAASPVFNGEKGILPVKLRNNGWKGDPLDVTVFYETSDYGKTWTFNEKYSLARIWADAWRTRDGRGRYEIMDKAMQADFRSQQFSPDNFVIRWSSPWVERYDVALEDGQAVVTYFYTDSTTMTYKGVERLSFGQEDGRMVITACSTETDMEEYVDTANWKKADAGAYSFSIPNYWRIWARPDGSTGILVGDQQIGSMTVRDYDASKPITQFEGSNGSPFITKELAGCKYPATDFVIRRTAADGSYEDEHHVYLIPEGSNYAYDLCLDTAWGNERADAIAKSFEVDTDAMEVRLTANKWAGAVKSRDGRAQYALLSSGLQKKMYADYEGFGWVTGVSSPWFDGYDMKIVKDKAFITYTMMTSTGFEGYSFETLNFKKENGRYVIDELTYPKIGRENGTVIAYLDDGNTWLSAKSKKDGMFSGMTLSIDGRTKEFAWETYGEPAFLPQLEYADVNGDGRSELVVILCKDEGTGINIEEIHVIDTKDLSEIKVQDPQAALKDRVVSKIDENGIKITIDGKSAVEFSQSELESIAGKREGWFKEPATDSIVDYSADDGRITANVAAVISPLGYLGEFRLNYAYEDSRLKVDTIDFNVPLTRMK